MLDRNRRVELWSRADERRLSFEAHAIIVMPEIAFSRVANICGEVQLIRMIDDRDQLVADSLHDFVTTALNHFPVDGIMHARWTKHGRSSQEIQKLGSICRACLNEVLTSSAIGTCTAWRLGRKLRNEFIWTQLIV